MYNGLCHTGSVSTSGNFGLWELIGLGLNLVLFAGFVAGLALLVVYAVRRARVPAAAPAQANGGPTTLETLQAQYARGEINREQYEVKKQNIEENRTES